MGLALREGLARYRNTSDWRGRWAALLPLGVQARLLWERLRGRLSYGEAAAYARKSALKPILLLSLLALAGSAAAFWRYDHLLTMKARAVYDRFGTGDGPAATLQVWRERPAVRSRLIALLGEDDARLRRAIATSWHLAHGALDPDRMREVLQLLEAGIANEPRMNVFWVSAYAAVARRLDDPTAVKTAAEALRALLETSGDLDMTWFLIDTYATVAPRLDDPAAAKAEVEALRALFEAAKDADTAGMLAQAYAAVAPRLDLAAVEAEAEALFAILEVVEDSVLADALTDAYVAVAQRLDDSTAVKTAAEALRARLKTPEGRRVMWILVRAYAAVAPRLDDPAAVKAEVEALRASLEAEAESPEAFAEAYAAMAPRLDLAAVEVEAEALRARLEAAESPSVVEALITAYVSVAPRLDDPAALKAGAETLRAHLETTEAPEVAEALADAYATVAPHLEPAAVKAETEVLRAGWRRRRTHTLRRAS